MIIARFVAGTLSVGMMVAGSNAVFSQDYPNKPVRIFTGQPGGSVNFLTRIMADALTGPLGQTVIVENRPTFVAISTVAKSPPDGYTLMLGSGSIWIGPLMEKLTYDAARDLAPVSIIAKQTSVLMAHPSLPVKTAKDLVALARAKPGALNYTSSSPGSASHIASILFKSAANINITYIPEGTTQADILLMSGQVELMFGTLGAAMGNIKAGKVRALAVTTAERSQLAPEIPTITESGVPGVDSPTTNAMFAPAKTPLAVIQKLNQEVVRAINTPGVREKMLSAGIEPTSSTPEQLATVVRTEIATVTKMIKDGAIKSANQ